MVKPDGSRQRVNFSLVEFLDYQLANKIILFINVFISLSYPLNFAIYCGMSRWEAFYTKILI